MGRGKQQGGDRQQNGPGHDPAEQKQSRRKNGQRQRPEHTVFSKTDYPNTTVKRGKQPIHHEIDRKRFIGPPAEPGSRNVEYHKPETAKASDLLQDFYSCVVPFIPKPIFARYRENDVWDHNSRHN